MIYGTVRGFGWLPRHVGPRPPLYGCVIGRHYPTRWEEYALALELACNLPPGIAVDAGCGTNPDIHLLPLMLSRGGWTVRASDLDPELEAMDPWPNVTRAVEPVTAIGVEDASVNLVVSISTFEHLDNATQAAAFAEAGRILKPGGYLVLTADWVPPVVLAAMAQPYGFDVGHEIPNLGESLSPNVSFLRACRVSP